MQPFHIQSQARKPFSFQRFSSIRKRPANPTPEATALPFTSMTYTAVPTVLPGAAARQAAAAANLDRQNQLRREEESQEQHTHRFLHGLIPDTSIRLDDEFKDNESGVDMTCASDIVRADSVTEKKMSMCNPLGRVSETAVLTCAR